LKDCKNDYYLYLVRGLSSSGMLCIVCAWSQICQNGLLVPSARVKQSRKLLVLLDSCRWDQ